MTRTGVFYLLKSKIIFSLDFPEIIAPGHFALFPRMIRALFPALDFESRHRLYIDSLYSIPRGRVVARGEKDPITGLYRCATMTLFAGKDCRQDEARLMRIFGLNDLDPARFTVETNYADSHYVTAKDGHWLVADVLKENQARFDSLPDEIHITGIPRRKPDPRRLRVDDGGFNDKLEVLVTSLAERLQELADGIDVPGDDDVKATKRRK